MLIFLYRVLFLPIFLCMLPFYGYRMWKRGGYLVDFKYRFGFLPKQKKTKKKRIWIQAVSVGEIKALSKLLKLFQSDERFEVVLTTTTSTGYALAKKLYSKMVAFVGIFPWDFWPFSALAWRRICPNAIVLMESELWPEHLHQAELRRVPVFLINARLSNKTFGWYSRYENVAKWMFDRIVKVGVCSEENVRRFVELGVDRKKMQFTGNLKFDVDVPPVSSEEKAQLKRELGFPEDSFVILGSSTWPGEEDMLIRCLSLLRKSSAKKWYLVLVPRHAERRQEIISLLRESKFSWHQRLRGPAKTEIDICLADTTGELARLTSVADIAFVGKSLLKNNGGQSPLDAAAYGVPMVYGDKMSNFVSICQSLESLGASIKVSSDIQAVQAIATLANDPQKRAQQSELLKAWYTGNCGASELTYKIIAERMFK